MPWKKPLILISILVIGTSAGIWGAPTLIHWVAVQSAPRSMNAYVRSHSVRKLQIGAGHVDYAGWLNTDIEPAGTEVYLDATKHFPLSDGSIQYIFGEHVIEHLTYEEGVAMLRECHRVLASKGKIRLATPNLLKYLQLFREPKTEEIERYLNAKLRWHQWPQTSNRESMILNLELHSFGHKFVYDPSTLSDSLSRAGFQAITQFPPGESDDPQLRGIEARHNSPDLRETNDYETMVLQAVRP
jgi:predicted SAM-dependent methyltransferase